MSLAFALVLAACVARAPAPTASIAAATEAMMATDAPVLLSALPSMMAMMRPGFSLSAARALPIAIDSHP